MISNEKVLIPHNDTYHLSVDVTDKISPKHLNSFIKTSLETANQQIEQNSKIFISYIDNANIYEIYHIKTTSQNIYLIYQIFDYNYINNYTNSIDLYITKEYFIVYKDSKFYFAKKNNNYQTTDIIRYINFHYKLDIDNTTILDNTQLLSLKEQFINSNIPPYNYINFSSNNEFKYYIYYIVSILFISFSLYIYNTNHYHNSNKIDIQNKLTTIKNRYKYLKNYQIKKQYKVKELIKFLNYLKIYHIYTTNIKYVDKLYTTIVANQKQQLYDFLSIYDKNIKIKSLKTLDGNKGFSMDIEIEL